MDNDNVMTVSIFGVIAIAVISLATVKIVESKSAKPPAPAKVTESGWSTNILEPYVPPARFHGIDTNAVAARFDHKLKERRDAFLSTMSFLRPGMSVDASAETIRDALAVAYDAGVIDGIRATKEMIKGE